uniref:Fe2OG dioxygenase domain-containing protein n=1 Tax=Corethron hystrix TaxID=216773 RepID=A0A6U5HGW6_9STRA|mmetsp:Transcript_30444/g.69704  ORF Transcript_30444/g.69704 Transcript_30444/m.69704 type:complete len:346 (+) Transcript_30444:50-1087(+)
MSRRTSSSSTAIDYVNLIREERRKIRHKKQNDSMPSSKKDMVDEEQNQGPKEKNAYKKMPDHPPYPLNEYPLCKTLSHFGSSLIAEDSSLERDLSYHAIFPDYLDRVFYVPDFLSLSYSSEANSRSSMGHRHQKSLLVHIVHSTDWIYLPHGRRHVHAGSLADLLRLPHYNYLQGLFEGLRQIFPDDRPPNHVLINLYGVSPEVDTSDVLSCGFRYSHEGILPHTDGPAYYPLTAALSLGQTESIHFTPRRGIKMEEVSNEQKKELAKRYTVKLVHGSLIVFEREAYIDYEHSIFPSDCETIGISNSNDSSPLCFHYSDSEQEKEKKKCASQCRVSLTLRHKYGV